VGSFGEHLRRERELRGISLDQIVATTKIGTRLLRALEEEQFDLLPGGIFNKSYVRAYAKCVGIDEDEAVAEYMEAANEEPADTRVIAQQHASIHSDRPRDRTGFPIMPVLILLVVMAGAVGGWKAYQEHQRERQPQLAVTASDAATPAAHPAASGEGNPASSNGNAHATSTSATSPNPSSSTQPLASAAKPPASSTASAVPGPARVVSTAAGASFELIVRPKGPAWVSIKSDGEIAVRGIIRPPDVKTIRATGQIVFYTGNAGSVDVSYNGKNVPLTGGPNEEQEIIFDSRGATPQAPAQ
jgi:cytoskeleton protein RodZ